MSTNETTRGALDAPGRVEAAVTASETSYMDTHTRAAKSRQFCSRCGKTTTDYRTDEYDLRTPAEHQAGREPIIRRFHVCADCQALEAAGLATTIIPGPGEDGYALTDEESAAEALAEHGRS